MFRSVLRKRLFFGGLLFVALSLGVSSYVRADILTYHPRSCLGTWENTINILGAPELTPNEGVSFFNDENSARLSGPGAQIFCGNFVTENDQPHIYTEARVRFIWAVIPKEESNNNVLEESATSSEISRFFGTTVFAEETVNETESSHTSISTDAINPTSVPQKETEEVSVTEEATPTTTSHEDNLNGADQKKDVINKSVETKTESSTSDNAEVHGKEEQNQEKPPSPESLNIVSETLSATSTHQEVLQVPFDPSVLPLDTVFASEDTDDILQISFSLNGKIWEHLGTVSIQNWKDSEFTLSGLHDFTHLKNLQIAVKGLSGSSKTHVVFLEGMQLVLEVNDSPVEVKKQDEKVKKLLPALHSCNATPFSQYISVGSTTMYAITLNPSDNSLPFHVNLGELPVGVTGVLGARTPDNQKDLQVSLTAQPDVLSGSYSLVVRYGETQSNGDTLFTACQYNLVIN